jgi:hypothetical protein
MFRMNPSSRVASAGERPSLKKWETLAEQWQRDGKPPLTCENGHIDA